MKRPKLKFLFAVPIVIFFYGSMAVGPDLQSAPQIASVPEGFKSIVGTYPGGVSDILATGNSVLVAQEEPVQITILDPDSGKTILTLTGQEKPVTAMAISADQKMLATADETGDEIRIWDVEKSEFLKSLKPPTQATSLAFGQQDTILAAGDKNGRINLLDLATDKAVRTMSIQGKGIIEILSGSPGKIMKIKFCPSGRFLAALEESGALVVWDLDEKETESADIHAVPPHQLWSIEFSLDGRYLLASGGFWSISIAPKASIKEVGGVLFLRDMSNRETYFLSTERRLIANAFFSADGEKVIYQASEPPVNLSKGMTQLLFICPVESLLKEEWGKETSRLKLGRGPLSRDSAFCSQKSIYLMFFGNKLYSWSIR